MPLFIYQATDRHGKLIKGKMEAAEKQQVVAMLQKQNFLPIQIGQEGTNWSNYLHFSFSNPFKEIGSKDILMFTRQLSTLLKAGINLDKSLFILSDMTEKRKFREIIEAVRKNVHAGSTLADALTKFPDIFTTLFISMVKVGEAGGVLDVVVERLSDFLEKTQKLKENVESAMIYPALLVLVGGSAVLILMIFVIPKFERIFADMGQELPLPAAILIGVSSFFMQYWWLIFLFLLMFGYIARLYFQTPEGRLKCDTTILEIPLIGQLVRKIEVSRFCRTLGTLVKGGVPILQSLLIIKEVINNKAISRTMENIHTGIKVGKGVSGPLKESNALPPLAIHMITIGEETGNLEDMLYKVADIYDDEVEISVNKIVALIGPVMILLMACVVGFIVLSLLTAIFSINEMPF